MQNLKILIRQIIRLRLIIIIALVILMAFAGYQTVNKLRIDNSLSIWFLEDDPSYRAYIDFQENFGSDEIYIAMFPVANALDSLKIKSLKKLTQDIEAFSYVKTTYSLVKAKYPIYTNQSIKFADLYTSKRSEKGLKNLL